jgi:predicted transposase YbfD/YdcC
MTVSFVEHFTTLKDPRIERHKRHELMDILVLSVCAVLSGADGWEAIAEFGRSKLEWLRRFVPLSNGVPSHDCMAYVISRLSPEGFRNCFVRWTESVRERMPDKVVAVDGKTSRGSRDRKRDRNPLHTVSAWAGANRLVLGQERTEEKSNEITAIPRLVELLELEGCLVTIDALGCQKDIAEQIVEQGGDYVLGLKGNQGGLHEAVGDYFTTAQAADFRSVRYDYAEEIDSEHGRLERRRYWITEDLGTLPHPERWRGLQSIGLVERECLEEGKRRLEQRYLITSIAAEARRLAGAVRGHWGVENRLHWRLDVVFREDESHIRIGQAPAIMTAIRHLCLNLFQIEKYHSEPFE